VLRGCYEDATGKMLPWNMVLTQRNVRIRLQQLKLAIDRGIARKVLRSVASVCLSVSMMFFDCWHVDGSWPYFADD